MEYSDEDFTILSLIPIEIMNRKIIIKLIRIALNYYNYRCLEYESTDNISYKKLKNQLYKYYLIEEINNQSYIINFYS